MQGQPVDEYIQMLKKEMRLQLKTYPTDELDTIFVGGGTPTSLNEESACSSYVSLSRRIAI